MDRTREYRTIVKQLFQEVDRMLPSEGGVTTELICDEENGHYQLGQVRWESDRRVDDVFLHVDIQAGKVWIQHDGTNLRIAEMLVDEGIPRNDIVLAFHPPELRRLTDYAAA